MRFSCLLSLATLFLAPAEQSLAEDAARISIPKGFPEFAVVTEIEDGGRAITITFPYASSNVLSTNRSDGAPPDIEVSAHTIRGERLAPRQVAKQVSRNSIVLITRDGKRPAEEYTKLLRDDLVVFVFKPKEPLAGFFRTTPQCAFWHLSVDAD